MFVYYVQSASVVEGETKTSLPALSTTTAAAATVAAAATTTATTTADTVRVPGDCNTLEEAVKRVHEDDCLTTIVLGEGEHVVALYQNKSGQDRNIKGK